MAYDREILGVSVQWCWVKVHGVPGQWGQISEPWMWLRMESILTSDEKKKVKTFWRLNLSLVTVTNDKFFFQKMS